MIINSALKLNLFTDEMLCNLIEHFSQHDLSICNVPNDMLGNAYEYLIKKFADDSGHTAAEFYTNRTVVKQMTLIADPQERESVYDPTCGSGGLLLNCTMLLKDHGKEYRTMRMYGQEIHPIPLKVGTREHLPTTPMDVISGEPLHRDVPTMLFSNTLCKV